MRVLDQKFVRHRSERASTLPGFVPQAGIASFLLAEGMTWAGTPDQLTAAWSDGFINILTVRVRVRSRLRTSNFMLSLLSYSFLSRTPEICIANT